MSKILLLGGEGYIGNVLSDLLLKQNYFVKSFDNLSYNQIKCVENKKKNSNYQFINGDICNPIELKRSFEDVECVVLLAGLVGDPITRKYKREAKNINYKGIQNVISLVSKNKKINKFIFISTCSNYGILNNNIKATEETKLNPVSDYSLAKVQAEKLIIQNHDTTKQNFILRFSTAFGISNRMRFDLTINEFTRSLFLNHKLTIFDQFTWRPYCHTSDFARVILNLIDRKTFNNSIEIYNVGSNMNNSTKKNLTDILTNKIDNCDFEFLENGIDSRNYMVSFDKLNNDFPNTKFLPIEEGIDEIIFYLKRGFFDDYDLNKNFYGNYELNF